MRHNKRFYFKLLSILTLLATLPVIIVGLFSYLKSSEIIEKNIAEEKEQSIYQIQTNFEQTLQTADLSVTTFVTSYQLLKALDEPLTPNQFQLYNQLKKEMNQLQRSDSGISDLLLVSFNEGWRLNNNGLKRIETSHTENIIEKYSSLPYKSSWLLEKKEQILFDSSEGTNCDFYINLVKKLPLNANYKGGIAIAYIPICDFNNILASNLDSETIIVLDENDVVVAHSDLSNIGDDLSDAPFIIELNAIKSDFGQYDLTLNESDYKVTFRKSAYNNWTYLSMIKISALNEQSNSIGWFTFITTTIILIGVIIFSYIASRRLYAPINRLSRTITSPPAGTMNDYKNSDEFTIIENQIVEMLQQNDELEMKLQGQVVQLKQFFMTRLLQGKLSNEELQSKLLSYEYPTSWKYFTVLSLQVDSLEDTMHDVENEDLLLFTINTMIEESILDNRRMTPVVVNKTQVTVFLMDEDSHTSMTEYISTRLQAIKTRIKDELGITVSIGISKKYTQLEEAHQGFKESTEALRHTLTLGPDSIIFFDNIQSDSSFFTFYPRHIEIELFNAIKAGDKDKVDHYLDELINALFNDKLSNTQYEIAIVRLLTNLIELTETLGVNIMKYGGHKSLFDQLYEFRSLTEVINWLKSLIIYPLMDKTEERMQSQYKNISDEIIHIVQQEYDTDLTLNYIAEKLHYNANYLSSIFRKETNTSFSEYLSLYRLNIAKKWLRETDITVKEIAERLNYNNSQNFIRSFKKVEGTTPGRYRQKNKV
ncbi:helix-turn-helix domain-containing protein [Sporosarcina ureilytica]|uniref:AraC family transcriptional regulator n=1 Tax=Sporosarcina ureilytica TaxID=298596 RepID=A0A1D8JIT1_9BACL|nr:helix-turn-helix domain-containing protein [Sporosarcina ureilytica]AOV08607.1 hypothetical protein BI350_14400 [Sporosarcina ureilytica]